MKRKLFSALTTTFFSGIMILSMTSCTTVDTQLGVSWKSPLGSIYNSNNSMYAPKQPLIATWEYKLETSTKSFPVSAGGVTVISDSNGTIYCLDNLDGTMVWSKQFVGGTNIQPVISVNKVLFADGSSTLYALNISNGNILWQQDIPSSMVGWALADTGKIWVATDNSLICFEESKGVRNYSHTTC